jgi:hypothetical protein
MALQKHDSIHSKGRLKECRSVRIASIVEYLSSGSPHTQVVGDDYSKTYP